MRGRIVSWSQCASSRLQCAGRWLLCACAVVGLLESRAYAVNPRVKIYRGTDIAARASHRDDVEPAAPRLSRQQLRQPGQQASATKPIAEPYSLTSFGTQKSLIDEANWGAEEGDSSEADESHGDGSYGDGSLGGDSYGDGSCDDGSCGSAGSCNACGSDACDGACVARYAPYGLSAAVEATYLNPGFENSDPGLEIPDNFGFEAAPRLWVQWQNGKGWGLRGRYWDFDADQQRQNVIDFDNLLGAQSLSDNLNVYAIDLELTRSFMLGGIQTCASFGARHARFHRSINQQLTIFDVQGEDSDDATAILQDVDHDFNGTGITMALGFRRPIGSSRLAAICNLRGSVLWGGNDFLYQLNVIEVVPSGDTLVVNDNQQLTNFGSNGVGMWVGELQAGGEWNTPLSSSVGAGNAFIRVLFEGQWWNLPGVNTGSEDFSTNDQLYDFLGVTAAIGYAR